MKNNLQSYLDAAKKARNTQPLLSQDEILRQLDYASPSSATTLTPWKVKTFVGGTALVAAMAVLLYTSNVKQPTEPVQSALVQQTESIPLTGTSLPVEPSVPAVLNDHSPQNSISQTTQGTQQKHGDKHPALSPTSVLRNSTVTTPEVPNSIVPEFSVASPPTSNTKDIKGVERLELTENEAVVLAAHYPKLHVWLQGTFSATDTCDITLAPSDKDKLESQHHHSAVLIRITFAHSAAREFLLWFTPNKEFTSALPGRYREQLVSELHALAEVETRCIPAEQACKAVKGDSPFFDLCRRESGALLGVSISPNPARDNAECTFTLKDQRDINISLHDLNGRFVRTMIFNELKPSGENKVPLMLEGVPAGAYLLAIRTERGEQAVQQLVVGQ